jgi:16S rRNA (cytosine1402-N4)-methyltransferase
MLPATHEEGWVTGSIAHRPVLLDETIDLLAPRPGATVVDGTLGAAGHALALLEAIGPDGRLLGIDRDLDALEIAHRRLAQFGDRFTALHGRHEDLAQLLRDAGVFSCNAILFDLGVSSMQLDRAERGFSFRNDAPLDMRMDSTRGESAADLLARIEETDLRRIIFRWGEERRSGVIARAIVREREKRPLVRTGQLAELIDRVAGASARRWRIHPATRTFQALRIVVNGEIEGLEQLVRDAVAMLPRGGRLAVISYHSLEDRAIKTSMRGLAKRCSCPPKLPVCGCGKENLIRVLTGRPIRPGEKEIDRNPRSRSARLRVAERL